MMYFCLPFNRLTMFWCGIMMAGMRQTFSTEPAKPKKKTEE